jgi:hypothetical protein
MNATEANSLVRGLVFISQKTRSDLSEALGDVPEILEDLNPLFFGPKAVLPHLLDWQKRAEQTGIIAGQDLFNFVKFLDMDQSGHIALGLLAIYGYTEVPLDGPPIEWMTTSWPYLTAGL